MKNFLFPFLVGLLLLASPAIAAAQATPTVSEEARELINSVGQNKAAVDSFLNTALANRDLARRENRRDDAIFFDKTGKFLRELRSFYDRIERAGEAMPAAKLASFKTEGERLEAKLKDLAAAPPPPSVAGITDWWLFQCFDKCWDKYPKFLDLPFRIGCKVKCLLGYAPK